MKYESATVIQLPPEEPQRRKAASMLHLTVWVAAIILQSALLGRNMYAVS